MADINKTVRHLLKWEGGFVNDPADPGGATMKGVTLETFRRFFGKEKTVRDLKNITDEQWTYIFKKGYWDKLQADRIDSQSVADILADWVYNSGTGMIGAVQKIVGAKADGVVGDNTINAINSADRKALFDKIKRERESFYRDIAERKPQMQKFLKGWLNRLDDCKYSEQ
jgi:lysozyme family protein